MKFDAVLIAGPTASGKSAAAMALAEEIGGVIVNADSMQVYRELRILTARPSDADMARVPHALYGHVSVTERYSAGRYQTDAIRALAEAREAGRIPIFTGGTGLYFGVLTDGIADIPIVPLEIHETARQKLLLEGPDAFHAALKARDPQTEVLTTDPQRMLRAYEVFEATGRPLSHWQADNGPAVLEGLEVAKFVLNPPRVLLHERIAARFTQMIDADVLEEARSLVGLDPTLPAAKILGLRELWAFEDGKMTSRQVNEAVITGTRQYAKRQTTWFRGKMPDWIWIPQHDLSNIIAEIKSRLA
jgi:tRNA dimethylallyltransferase